MLEIIVSLRRAQGEGEIGGAQNTTTKKVGDIMVAKKSPAPWGNEEKRLFLITLLNDPGLELTIKDGTVRVNPYGVIEEREDASGEMVATLVNKSGKRVDMDMFDGSPGLDPTDITSEPVTVPALDRPTKYCRTCAKTFNVGEGNFTCPTCGGDLRDFLVPEDLVEDVTPRE